MHNPNVVLLGNVPSSVKEIDNRKGTIAAGTAVRLKSDDTISVAKADGSLLGISCGQDLALAGRTAIVRKGLSVPILLTAAFTPVIGAQVHISDSTGLAAASGAGATAVNAKYVTSTKTGKTEAGVDANVALIDFEGGL